MSDLERSEHGALTESPTLLPDHGGPVRPVSRDETAVEPTDPNGSEPPRSESGGASDRPPLLDENGLPKKRRRRGPRDPRPRPRVSATAGRELRYPLPRRERRKVRRSAGAGAAGEGGARPAAQSGSTARAPRPCVPREAVASRPRRATWTRAF